MRKLFTILLGFVISVSLKAQGVVVITDDNATNEKIELSGNLFYFIDTLDAYSFQEVLSPAFDSRFIQSARCKFFYNKRSYSQWYKIEVLNNSSEIQHLVLSINNPLLDNITFFSQNDSSYYHTGLNHAFKQRPTIFKNYLFPITLDPGEKSLYSFKIAGQVFPVYIPITLHTQTYVERQLRVYSFLQGAFYCVIIILTLILILLWKYENNKSYFFLLLILTFLAFFTLWRHGHLFHFLFPNSPQINIVIRKSLYAIGIVFIAIFQWNYFDVVRAPRKLRRALFVFIIGATAFTLLQWVLPAYEFFQYGIYTAIILLTIISGFIVHHAFKQNSKFGKLMSGVVILILVDLNAQIFFNFSIRGFSFIDIQISSLTAVIMFLIIFWIFALKFQSFKLEVTSMKKNLEGLVEKRTYQLNSQKEELRSQHEELVLQKETLQLQREELRAQKELLEVKNTELAKLSLVASKTDNLIYIFNPDGELDWYNASVGQSLGIPFEDYEQHGKRLNFIDISTNKNIRHVLNTCLREKLVVSYESTITDKENNIKWYHTTLTPILDENDNVKHLITIDTEITRLKQYEVELEQQQKDSEQQKNLAIKRKEELEERQVEIYDSIRYAKRIQTAIMPKVKQIQRDFYDSFVLFLPKDIVSGDFYWYHRIEDKYFIAAVDCTGHGVPGAFMSIIGTYLLNSIIIHNGVSDPAEILRQLNRKVKISLKADNHTQTSDGMDIALVVIDKNKKTLDYAGALRPLYLFSGGDFNEVKGDKTPITSSISGTSLSSYTRQTFDFNEGDMFYIFSDGIIDQFGGNQGKKFLTKRFKQLLFEINPLSMKEQKEIIKNALDEWKGEYDQVDDILVIGLRYSEPFKF